MSDPLDALREPIRPEAPDSTFARALRERIARQLLEVPMLQQLSPYLAVADGQRAIEYYTEVFGARLEGEPIIMPDGRLGHATLWIDSFRLFLADEFPDMHLVAPSNAGSVGVTLHLSFSDSATVDAVAARGVAAGGTLERPVEAGRYGYGGVLLDPSGHRWLLMTEA